MYAGAATSSAARSIADEPDPVEAHAAHPDPATLIA
ncbi:hypothetical protein NX02_00170 [Sphingomonas sanxanigenens DSM 19645 = NX02]|uniref:Uncharacterized protein n=1 Tax=Sphingomonas sanxanigenens DSM 19645 = NX02 TaxID=1123269 RepID=W0A636_9SPHN|nr:hypothetical protein NX02_00170 [Sphingomonas sanxanigenens DSM 19645 = NX02]